MSSGPYHLRGKTTHFFLKRKIFFHLYYALIQTTQGQQLISFWQIATNLQNFYFNHYFYRNNEKRRPQKEFASVANTVSLMRSKINKYSKRGNEQTETSIPDPSNKTKNWREEAVDSFDDDDDDIEFEGIYAGIDDDYPVENNGSTPHLTSVMTSYRWNFVNFGMDPEWDIMAYISIASELYS